MSNVHIVYSIDDDGVVITEGAFISARQAHDKADECRSKCANGNIGFFVQSTEIVGADENTFLKLQRQLSRVQNRLGKARNANRTLRHKHDKLIEFMKKEIDNTFAPADPFFANQKESDH